MGTIQDEDRMMNTAKRISVCSALFCHVQPFLGCSLLVVLKINISDYGGVM